MIKGISIALASFLLFSVSDLFSQSTLNGNKVISKQKYEVLDEIFDAYTIYDIPVTKADISITAKTPSLIIDLGDQVFDLNLHTDNLSISYNAKKLPLLLGGAYRSGGSVSLTINDNFIYGFMKLGKSHKFIEPLWYFEKGAAKSLYIVYDARDVKEDKEHVCGVTETAKREKNYKPQKAITACKIIDLGIANTFDMVTSYGNSTNVQDHNLAVLNNVQTNYRSEFSMNLEFNVVSHYVPTASSNDPLNPVTATTDAGTLLSNFRSWAEDPGSCSGCFGICGGGNCGGANGGFGVDYTMASLWTDRNIQFNGNAGVVGLAYTPGWHHLLEDYTTSAANLNAMVTHEKGHNFSANHDASGSNFIMAPSVTLTPNWSAASKTSINNRINAQGYLVDCSTLGAPVADFFQSAKAICTGSTVEYEEQSQYGATRDWEFAGGTPATSVEEKETVTYSTAGLYAVKLTAANSAGSDIKFNYVDVEAAPPTPCTPSTGGSGGGITLLNLSNVSNGSGTAGVYEDFSCTSVATLEASTTYNFVVGVSGVTRLRYFIDYNDDGDFLDANEASNTVSFSGSGNLGLSMTTPSTVTMESILRMRIITSTSSIGSNGCTSPATGQVEDYGVYFEVAQVFGCTDPNSGNYDPAATIDDGSCSSAGTTWYFDGDNDTYGDPNNKTVAPTVPPGYVADDSDCNDDDATVFPGATELCDGQINDCNSSTLPTTEVDNDGDGYVECMIDVGGWDGVPIVIGGDDCNDGDVTINPGAIEICNSVDDNCDGQVDEGVLLTFYEDGDGDGYGDNSSSANGCSIPVGYVTDNTDCNDADATIFPGASELCDGQINDCNSSTLPATEVDSDSDGYVECMIDAGGWDGVSSVIGGDDCNDSVASINPGATEICNNIDDDCDGLIDENGNTTYYADTDSDGYGDSANTTTSCSAPAGYVSDNTDCDDSNSSINPGATEACNGVDDNCDGTIDEGCSVSSCDGSYLVINTITQNIYRAEIKIESTATVNSTNDILFTAGTEIELKPGFEVILGTDFEARIEPCTNFVSGPAVGMVDMGDLTDNISGLFGTENNLNVTIISIDNIIQASGEIKASNIERFVVDNMLGLEKGTYRLIVNDLVQEYTQDVLVIE